MKYKKRYVLLLVSMCMGTLFLLKNESARNGVKTKKKDGLKLLVQEANDKKGWAYSVYDKDQLLIHQEILPVLIGNQRIPTKEVAEKLGTIVLEKIRNKQMPVISEIELRTVIPYVSAKDSIL